MKDKTPNLLQDPLSRGLLIMTCALFLLPFVFYTVPFFLF